VRSERPAKKSWGRWRGLTLERIMLLLFDTVNVDLSPE
jgi:hypothetical protein